MQSLIARATSRALVPAQAPAPLSASPDPRVPCVMVLDRSASMYGEKIDQLNAATAEFGQFLRKDRRTAVNTEFAVVSVGGDVRVESPFMPADDFLPTVLKADGDTPLGAGTLTALQLLGDRLAVYRQNDVEHHLPWFMLISDGQETASPTEFANAGAALRKLEKAGLIRAFVVGVDGADVGKLQTLTTGRPLTLRGLKFAALFAWLYRSLRTVSQGRPGEDYEPQDPTRAGWAE